MEWQCNLILKCAQKINFPIYVQHFKNSFVAIRHVRISKSAMGPEKTHVARAPTAKSQYTGWSYFDELCVRAVSFPKPQIPQTDRPAGKARL